MKLNILISSAVILEEKDAVKNNLTEMLDQHEIAHEIYDCNDHSTSWDFIPKQRLINDKIVNLVDWFICLVPHYQVGEKTWEELRTILQEKKVGSAAVVSVFHPKDQPAEERNAPLDNGMITFDQIREEAKQLLGCDEELYWVSYRYGDRDDLCKQVNEEFRKSYFNDKLFRTQHLIGLSCLGRDVEPQAIYFDKERARIDNGFIATKYFPRENVDGVLQNALLSERQITVLLGPPASGKTRAMYQLMADPSKLAYTGTDMYGLGMLADKQVIVLDRNNIRDVYDFLKEEQNYIAQHRPLGTYYMVCDQLKDVLTMLDREKMYEFLDMVVRYNHVRLIATSIPTAFANLCDICKDHGYRHFSNEETTKIIEIPLISKDPHVDELRNWIKRELRDKYEGGETIGDFIPGLNNYRQFIVNRIYDEASSNPFLPYFLRAIQTTETYRYLTALFLPVVISAKCYDDYDGRIGEEMRKKLVDTLNFLIRNNVIWVKAPDGRIVQELTQRDFKLNRDRDDESKFIFDGELFNSTPISTEFSYGINEIVWEELEKENRDRQLKGDDAETLLYDLTNSDDVVDSAKDFYLSFKRISTLRRILPRIPSTEGNKAQSELWHFISKKLSEQNVTPENKADFRIAIGHVISRAENIHEVKSAFALFEKKDISPDHDTIGELLSVIRRKGDEYKEEIFSIVEQTRQTYQLQYHSPYSLSTELIVRQASFDEMLEQISNTKYVVDTDGGEVLTTLDEMHNLSIKKLHLFSVRGLLNALENKAVTEEQCDTVLSLYQQAGLQIHSTMLYRYFLKFADSHSLEGKDWRHEPASLLVEKLEKLLNTYASVIDPNMAEAPFFSAVNATWCFKQAIPVYDLYLKTYGRDNSKLLLVMLKSVRDHEFQLACRYLYEADERFKKEGSCLNICCFNKLIQKAPNPSEAISVLPHLSIVQEQTLVNILNVMKNRRNDGLKLFFYAYSVVMQPQFREYRTSSHIIGSLYYMASTRKQERFIREVFLEDLTEEKKVELIEHSTSITSIRIVNNYTTLDQVWEMFNTCRNYHKYEKLYIKSDLYSQLMRSVSYQCRHDRELWEREMGKVRNIINEDLHRILRDQVFYSSLYRYFPDKKIFNDDHSVSNQFIADMEASDVVDIRVWNNILKWMLRKRMPFACFRSFFTFITDYYTNHLRLRNLLPNDLTASFMMDAVTTEEEFHHVEELINRWIASHTEKNAYSDCVKNAKKRLGMAYERSEYHARNRDGYMENKSDFASRTDEVINYALKEISYFGFLSSSRLNYGLKKICDIIEDIKKNMRRDVRVKCSSATYWNIKNNLLMRYADDIWFNNMSYMYLIKISPNTFEAGIWLKRLFEEKKETYKYDRVLCADLAQEKMVAQYDISVSREFFAYWEAIMHDVGYDPNDPDSIPLAEEKQDDSELKTYEKMPDYNGYWLTRASHVRREQAQYVRKLYDRSGSVVDKVALQFIRDEMERFREFDILFPRYNTSPTEVFDFEQEFHYLPE